VNSSNEIRQEPPPEKKWRLSSSGQSSSRSVSVVNSGAIEDEVVRDATAFNRARLMGFGLLGFMALAGLVFLMNHLIIKKYMAPFYQDKTSIVFGEGEQKKVIDDPDEVTLFRRAIINAQDLDGHHTSSIDEMRFFFPDKASNNFHLGRDSENEGEFWLTAAGPLGTIYLKQFRSEPLGEWLRRNRLR
jgi:hypothetical protein